MSDLLTFRRDVRPGDDESVRKLILSSGFFYDIEVPVAVELVEEKLKYGADCDYEFLFAEIDGKTIAYSCFGPIAGAEGAFDLYWIATLNNLRGTGIGRKLIEATHEIIVQMGGRFVIAETSTLEKYAPTRQFYEKTGYVNEATIRDFYKVGDGKVFFVKRF